MIYADLTPEGLISLVASSQEEAILLRGTVNKLPFKRMSGKKIVIPVYDFQTFKDLMKKHYPKLERRGSGVLRDMYFSTDPAIDAWISNIPNITSRKLHPFQEVGIEFLMKRHRAFLADSQGMGKSTTALLAAKGLLDLGKVKKVFIVVPKNALLSWDNTFPIVLPKLKYERITAEKVAAIRENQYKSSKSVFLVSLDTLKSDLGKKKYLMYDGTFSNSLVMVDEVHRLKGDSKVSARMSELGKIAKYGWGISGTPLDGKLDALIGVMDFVDSNFFMSKTQAYRNYAITDWWGTVVEVKNINHLNQRLQQVMIRHRKEEEIKTLPPKVYIQYPVSLSSKERKIYDDIIDGNASFESEEVNAKVLSVSDMAMVRELYAQIALDSISLLDSTFTEPSSKMLVLKEILENISGKVVIFTKFEKMVKLLSEWLAYTNVTLTGTDSPSQRKKKITGFLTDPNIRLFIMDTAGSESIDLHGSYVKNKWVPAASHMIRFDLYLGLDRHLQVEDRIHRIGCIETVKIINIICTNTIEEKYIKALSTKNSITTSIIDHSNF